MDYKHTFADAVRYAKLSQRELAELLRVTLVTAHRYVHGQEAQSKLLERQRLTHTVIEILLMQEKLPLRYSTRGEDKIKRKAAIAKIQQHIDARLRG